MLARRQRLLIFEIRGSGSRASFLALVLAMALLGPAPAAAHRRRLRARRRARAPAGRSTSALVNIATFAVFPLVGGLAIEFLVGGSVVHGGDPLGFAAVVLLVFMVDQHAELR